MSRKKAQRWAILLILISITLPALAMSLQEVIIIDDFTDGLDGKWQVKSFTGNTRYTHFSDNKHAGIMAVSKGTASGLYHELKYSPRDYPYLSWSWKIQHILSTGDATTKSGDDYAARIYIIFPSLFFWKTKVLNYIWANKLPKGEAIPSSYTKNSIMIAVESGNENSGRWMKETRNIHEDFLRHFGSPPPKVGAIALMTDTDNTGEEALAWYGPITISRHE
ncbi:DUF3047 domain-containing protein [Thermodesulfobacteriota bacterium]